MFAGEIRHFDLRTIETLGKELSYRDSIAARASDAVLDTHPVAKSLKLRGWITDRRRDSDVVYLIAETPSGPRLAYAVTFRGSGNPRVEDERGQPLPPNVAVRYAALQTTTRALAGKLFDAKYNFEVLNDPDGGGFLVYALAATTTNGEVITGGHYRVTVSADGARVEHIDLLSAFVRMKQKTTELQMLVSTQHSSNLPAETWIYTSNLYRVPVMLGTADGTGWLIEKGHIRRFTKAEQDALEAAKKR